MVRQQYDYSCGLAALATLFTYAFRSPVSEKALLSAVAERPERFSDDYAADGLSLADLADLAQQFGARAQGIAAPAEVLLKLRAPALVYLEDHGQAHFSVLRGVDRESGRLLLADPSWGLLRLTSAQFGQLYRGRLLLVGPPKDANPDPGYFRHRISAPTRWPALLRPQLFHH